MADFELSDRAVDARLSEPRELGRGRYRYERYSVTLDGADLQRDAMRIGRIVVVLPVDIERAEVVMLRQFRLGAHLATGKGELVEVVAGHVEPGEDLVGSARRECEEEIGVAPSSLISLFDLVPTPGASDEHMFFFLGVVDAADIPERAGARTSPSTRGRFVCRSSARLRPFVPGTCATVRQSSACNGWL